MINLVKISKFKAKQLGVTHLSVKQTLANCLKNKNLFIRKRKVRAKSISWTTKL